MGGCSLSAGVPGDLPPAEDMEEASPGAVPPHVTHRHNHKPDRQQPPRHPGPSPSVWLHIFPWLPMTSQLGQVDPPEPGGPGPAPPLQTPLFSPTRWFTHHLCHHPDPQTHTRPGLTSASARSVLSLLCQQRSLALWEGTLNSSMYQFPWCEYQKLILSYQSDVTGCHGIGKRCPVTCNKCREPQTHRK